MKQVKPLIHSELPALKLIRRGKVRDIYECGEDLLLVATDRLSAFDQVLPTPLPGRGMLLNFLTNFWFGFFYDVPNQVVSVNQREISAKVGSGSGTCLGRMQLVRRAEPSPVEWVVRGFLAGSAWKEYQATGCVGSLRLPSGLSKGVKLPDPLLTPSWKAETGHDTPATWKDVCLRLGKERADKLKKLTLNLYHRAAAKAWNAGLVLVDTKFEWGEWHGEDILIDEVLTSDSSRYWKKEDFEKGDIALALDKENIRDYLRTVPWEGDGPPPPLPSEVVEETLNRYREVCLRLVGEAPI